MTKSTITREPITHYLKIYPEFFSAVCTGVKRAELRKNDRDYRVGDTLHLMETPRGSCHQTGEFINVKITHIADVGEWMPGYVLLSIEREALDSESVILYRERNPYNGLTTGWQELTENEISFLKENAGENAEFLKLYRHAQPAPVVPDAATAIRACLSEFPESARDIVEECADIAENACRAAMLQAEPVTTANKLGNSPAIPDTWIPVSERMPEDEQEVLTINRMGHRFVSLFDKHSGLFFDRLDAPSACCIEHVLVTHWMELPAAPQEVKP